MASLSSLILQRQKVLNQVVPNDLGDVFYTAYNNQSCCTYLWSSPGTGVAVIELWEPAAVELACAAAVDMVFQATVEPTVASVCG